MVVCGEADCGDGHGGCSNKTIFTIYSTNFTHYLNCLSSSWIHSFHRFHHPFHSFTHSTNPSIYLSPQIYSNPLISPPFQTFPSKPTTHFTNSTFQTYHPTYLPNLPPLHLPSKPTPSPTFQTYHPSTHLPNPPPSRPRPSRTTRYRPTNSTSIG